MLPEKRSVPHIHSRAVVTSSMAMASLMPSLALSVPLTGRDSASSAIAWKIW